MAEKALQLQHQIRENAQELGDFLGDLNKWEKDIKKKDEELKKTNAIEQNAVPIRKVVKKEKKKTEMKKEKGKEKVEQRKPKISSYDYDAWSKFNVDAECEKIDKDEEEAESEESETEEDLEAQLEIEEQRRLQRAVLEKDKGNDLFKEGKYEAAINRYTTAVGLDPKNAIAFANRAMALLKLERYAAAEEDCSKSLSIDPEYVKAIARRATARTKLKNYLAAIEDQENLLRLQPNNKQAKTDLEKLKKEAEKLKNTPKVPEQRKRRSNKPLRRILIEEIGSDEDEPKTTESALYNDAAKEVKSSVELLNKRIGESQKLETLESGKTNKDVKERTELQIPVSPVQFERDFQKIKKNMEEFYRYFSIIPTKMYKSLFHHSIDEVLPRALEAFHRYYTRDNKEYWMELCSLVDVPRFDMAQMFLSRDSKRVAHELFEEFINKDFENKEWKNKVCALAKKYGITLKDR